MVVSKEEKAHGLLEDAMRNNQPITQVDHPMKEGTFIVSTTDLKGRITSVNEEFVRISGFSEDELIGQPHNLVRHPDMPSLMFQSLWQSLQAGKAWNGIIKNRCKNGDHYWVDASVSPVRRGSEVVGYVSVRSKPTAGQIREAEGLYAALRAGRSLEEVTRRRWIPFPNMPFHVRLLMSTGTAALFLLLLFAAIAWSQSLESGAANPAATRARKSGSPIFARATERSPQERARGKGATRRSPSRYPRAPSPAVPSGRRSAPNRRRS